MPIRIWLVSILGVPGPDLRHMSESSAKREVAAARRKGFEASYRSLLLYLS